MPRSCLFFALLLVSTSSALAENLPAVPDGFTIEKVAAAPLVRAPMMGGFDEQGRLYLAESAGKNLRAADLLKDPPNFIRRLEDTDGDGVFDRSTIFADKMTLPMGILWYRGALYVASPPSIWKLEDTDGDGVADRRTELVTKFGFTGNAASVHGCFLGPSGRIYWCDGRHGHEFRDESGKIVSKGKAARIFSCLPDGSDVRSYCGGGMDNPVEIDFAPSGEMLGSVNILYNRPRRVDCLVHWAEGGVYPHADQTECIAEFKRTGPLMPPMTELGHVAVSGMLRYRSGHFGPEYKDNLFTTIFNQHKVIRSKVTRTGATFRTVEEDFFVDANPDSHPTDVVEDADGSLLVIDTGGWFRIGCPTSQIAKPELLGAIYRIRREGAKRPSDPRGAKIAWKRSGPRQLVRYLDDPRPVVRERAIDTLARRGEAAARALADVVSSKDAAVRSRRNAVWSLSRIGTEAARSAIRGALSDSELSVRIAAARSLGVLEDPAAAEELVEMVSTDDPAVRRETAEALGRIRETHRGSKNERQSALAALFGAVPLARQDRHLEHALIFAVLRIADAEATVPFLADANPYVKRAALIALDQLPGGLTRERVLPLLDTDNQELQSEALAVISRRSGWAGETRGLLAKWIDDRDLPEQKLRSLRGFLLAQADDAEIQQLVAKSLKRAETPQVRRLLLLEVIERSHPERFPETWLAPVQDTLSSEANELRAAGIRIVRRHALTDFDETLLAIAHDSGVPAALRTDALGAVAPRMKSLDKSSFEVLVSRVGIDAAPLERLAAARALAEAPLEEKQLLRLAKRLTNADSLTFPVLLRAFAGKSSVRVGLALTSALVAAPAADRLPRNELDRVLKSYPDEVRRSAEPLYRRLAAGAEAQRARLDELADALEGGDPERGREIFFGRKAACASCHRIDAQGASIGPDLSKIGAIRAPRDLLEAIVLPSASFARGYRSYAVATDEGKILTGIVSRETSEAVHLKTGELAEIRVPKDAIAELAESDVSIMPSGLDRTLSRDELRDVIAFLRERK